MVTTRRKQNLKSKNTGLGLSISISEQADSSNNKKIVFDEENLPVADDLDENRINEPKNSEISPAKYEDSEDIKDHDDDDDAVEEVKGSAAREEALEQLKSEERGAIKPKKRKKRKDRRLVVEESKSQAKDANSDEEEDDEDFDDDFFAKLEDAKAEQETAKQEHKSKGKHTTFIFEEYGDESMGADPMAPKEVGHNIQVVVLPDRESSDSVPMEDAITAIPTNPLSADALNFSRSRLVNGSDTAGVGKKKRKGAPKRPDTSWKRSRKMSLLVGRQARFNRRGGRGQPAANFVSGR